MQRSFVPIYHHRFPRVYWHLHIKPISSFLISTHVFFCTKLISNYTLFVQSGLKVMAEN